MRCIKVPIRNKLDTLRIFVQNRIFARLKPPRPINLRVFYIGGYWRGPNDMVAQMLHGLKATGVNIIDFNTNNNQDALDTDGHPYDMGTSYPVWLVKDKVFPRILHFRPHIIICNAGGLSFRPRDAAFLRKIGIKLLGIVLSDPEVYEPTTSKIARNFDVLYTVVSQYVEKYRQLGVEAYYLPMATNPLFFHPVPARMEYKCDVLFLGAVHSDRVEPVKALVEHFNTHVHGENWEKYGIPNRGLLDGDDSLSALNSAKLAVIFSKTVSGFQGVKVGILDFLSAGCLVITDYIPGLERYFVVGKEIITFQDTSDMVDKIGYYLDHHEEADAIRRAGHNRVVNNYTWDKIWIRVLPTVIQMDGWETDFGWTEQYFLQ